MPSDNKEINLDTVKSVKVSEIVPKEETSPKLEKEKNVAAYGKYKKLGNRTTLPFNVNYGPYGEKYVRGYLSRDMSYSVHLKLFDTR